MGVSNRESRGQLIAYNGRDITFPDYAAWITLFKPGFSSKYIISGASGTPENFNYKLNYETEKYLNYKRDQNKLGHSQLETPTKVEWPYTP